MWKWFFWWLQQSREIERILWIVSEMNSNTFSLLQVRLKDHQRPSRLFVHQHSASFPICWRTPPHTPCTHQQNEKLLLCQLCLFDGHGHCKNVKVFIIMNVTLDITERADTYPTIGFWKLMFFFASSSIACVSGWYLSKYFINWPIHQTDGSPWRRMIRSDKSLGMDKGRKGGRGESMSTIGSSITWVSFFPVK